MAFEVMLVPTQRGAAREVRNPFTGEEIVAADEEMDAGELAAARAVLARYPRLPGGGDGALDLGDARLELSLDAGGSLVKVLGDLARAAEVLFEVARAGNLVVAPTSDGPVVATTVEALRRARDLEALAGDGGFVLASDAGELAEALRAPCDAARAYADRAIG